MTDGATSVAPAASAMAPVPYRVRSRVIESPDSATLCLEPLGEALRSPEPGEFMMLYAFGVGAASRALHDAQPGTVVGVRGPFGTTWGLSEAAGRDLVMVAGGVGLCPLRPAILGALAQRARYGKVMLIVGARSRADFVFAAQLEKWAEDPRIELHVTVDVPVQGWRGEVGLGTEPLRRLHLDPGRTPP